MDVDQLRARERIAWFTWRDHLLGCSRCLRSYARHRYADAGCVTGSDVYGRWQIASRKHLSSLNPSYACGVAS